MTINGWVDRFITEVMQTCCELPTDACRAHFARFVVARQQAKRISSNQDQALDDHSRI
jgi:hypothetical protein